MGIKEVSIYKASIILRKLYMNTLRGLFVQFDVNCNINLHNLREFPELYIDNFRRILYNIKQCVSY